MQYLSVKHLRLLDHSINRIQKKNQSAFCASNNIDIELLPFPDAAFASKSLQIKKGLKEKENLESLKLFMWRAGICLSKLTSRHSHPLLIPADVNGQDCPEKPPNQMWEMALSHLIQDILQSYCNHTNFCKKIKLSRSLSHTLTHKCCVCLDTQRDSIYAIFFLPMAKSDDKLITLQIKRK